MTRPTGGMGVNLPGRRLLPTTQRHWCYECGEAHAYEKPCVRLAEYQARIELAKPRKRV